MNSTPYFPPKYFPATYFPTYVHSSATTPVPSPPTTGDGHTYYAPTYYPPTYFPWTCVAGVPEGPGEAPEIPELTLLEAIVDSLEESSEFGEVRALASLAECDQLAMDRLPFLGVVPDGWEMVYQDSNGVLERSDFEVRIVTTELEGQSGAIELLRLFKVVRTAIDAAPLAADLVPRLTRWGKVTVGHMGDYRYAINARLSISLLRILS